MNGPDGRFDRRRFLLGAAGATGLAATGWASDAGASQTRRNSSRRRGGRAADPVRTAVLASGVRVPTAEWLVAENAKPGTIDWVVTGVQQAGAIEGFASQVSASRGDEVIVFVNTVARTVQVQAYRMGHYGGLGGRLVYQSDPVAGQRQPPPSITPGVSTVSCQWSPTVTVKVDRSWPPGCYLLKLVGDGGEQQYVPLTVRDDTSTAAYVLQNSVTTWQAYNLWGGYSLYYGQSPGGGQTFADRSRIVSFDRPYPKKWAQGSADFLGNEFPVLYQMESLGLDMTYWTDVDLHARPHLVARHRCLFSMGHDEYWSTPMRDGVQAALESGTNLAFLGANACYRQIRLQPTPVGPDRLEVCYKDAAEDPLAAEDPQLATVNWEQPPVNLPESTLIGSMYQSVGADDDLVITDASAWLYDGCGVTDGQRLASVVQGEYDRYMPGFPGPTNADVFAHSPVVGQGNWSDISYYTAGRAGGGVVAIGAASFVNKLSNTTAFPWNVVPKAIPGVTEILLRAMENVYGTFGHGPASKVRPSTGNWSATYQGAAAGDRAPADQYRLRTRAPHDRERFPGAPSVASYSLRLHRTHARKRAVSREQVGTGGRRRHPHEGRAQGRGGRAQWPRRRRVGQRQEG